MTAVLQKRLAQVSLGFQSELGTPAEEGMFMFGVTDGSVVKTDVTENALDTTWTTRLVEGYERLTVNAGGEFGCVPGRELIGQLLYALLGSDTVVGDAPPYAHTIVEGEPLPYFTLFGRQDDDYLIVQDCLLDTLELSFELTGALKAKCTFMGTELTDSVTPWTTSGPDQRVQDGYWSMGGGSFTIDTVSSLITKGTLTLKNNLKPVQAAFDVSPLDHVPGILELSYAATIFAASFDEWRKVIFGVDTLPASGISPVPHYGAFAQEWLSGATDTLSLAAPKVKTMVAFPEAAVEGGPVELEIAGETAINLDGEAVTWVVDNSTALYS